MLQSISMYPIFGIPLLAYGGILTLSCFLITAWMGITNKPVQQHKTMAMISIGLALIHGTLGVLLLF